MKTGTSTYCYEVKDPLTGELFVTNRTDQRFANRRNQIMFNNRIAQEKRRLKAPYDKPLDRNRAILKSVLGKSREVTKSRDYLEALGYHFGLSMYQLVVDKKTNLTAKGIYEYLIINLDNNHFKITYNDEIHRN